MFIPQNFTLTLLMLIVCAICWGSWANPMKLTKNYRFEHFYWDYAIGILVISTGLALTMGSLDHGPTSFWNNVLSATPDTIYSALIGGAIFNIANLLLVIAIDMAGISIAIPIAIGIALVVGVVLSYSLQPKGDILFLGLGVLLAIGAVIMNGKAYASLASAAGGGASRKSVVICIISGVLMGLFAPFVTHSLTAAAPLTPYSVAVFFCLGAFLSCFVFNIYFMKRPLVGEPVRLRDFFKTSWQNHMLGLLSGVIWGVGTVFNFVAASASGVAISYAIGQSAPMVAALWGIFVFKEFAGANRKSYTCLGLMFLFYVMAICAVAMAYTAQA